nr:chloride channel protein [Synechococcus sp. J7-Johnson]
MKFWRRSLQLSGPKPEAGSAAPLEGDTRGLPFQWSLLAWAALVGILTGVAVVGFHYLLGFINNFLFGTLVEWVLDLVSSQQLDTTTVEVFSAPDPDSGTPLKALLQLGLGGVGFLPPPPPPLPEPTPLPPIGPSGWLASWPVVIAPLLGGVAVGLLRQVGRDLGPSLPSLMAMADGAAPALPRLPGLRLVAASLSLGSGASLGPEGPSVESGGNLGLWVALRGRLPPESQKALVAAGVAAGLAAGFKAPIAGVFFAFEGAYSAIPGRPSLRAVLVAAVASSLVTQLCLGDEPIFRLPVYEVRSPLELPLYLGLGLVASLMSWALVSLLAAGRSEPVQQRFARLPLWLLNGLGGLGVGVMALGFPQVLGVGYDTIEALLGSEGGVALTTLAALLVVKLLATGLSNATGFVGGGFAPALFLGAVLGNLYGQLLGDSGFGLPVAEPPAYAMVGMAAVLAGSARAPLTALLLLFELTHDIRIVLPLMAATGLSAVLVERWQGLADPGMLGPDPAEEERRQGLAALPVIEALEAEAPLVLKADIPARAALGLLIEAHGHCLVVERDGWVIGVVTLIDLQRAISAGHGGEGLPLEECRRSDLLWLPAQANLAQLEDQLVPNGLRQVPVFDLDGPGLAQLPAGLPNSGLPAHALLGLASRDGMARALARKLRI